MVRLAYESVWERLLQPAEDTMPPDVARFMLNLQFSEKDKQRVDELSIKAQNGALSPTETEELDEFLNAGNALAILKSKARLALRRLESRAS